MLIIMTIERELLERVVSGDDDGDFFISHRLYKDIETFLAQPEQDKAEAIMPNGVRVSNVYDAYEEGRKSVMSEQDPVAWKVIDGTNGNYMFSRIKPTERSYKYDVVIPLYTAPPKREPLSDKEITKNTPKLIHIGERLAFHAGVRFSERHHGIGVNDDT